MLSLVWSYQKQKSVLSSVGYCVIWWMLCGCYEGRTRLPASVGNSQPSIIGSTSPSPSKDVSSVLTDQRLRVGDMVSVSFPSDSLYCKFNSEHLVGRDGTISLPFNVNVQAVGLTTEELEARIHEHYVPKLLTRLTVEVARLDGMVRVIDGSGRVHLVNPQGEVTVLRAVSLALGEPGQHKTIEIIRANGTRLTMDSIKAMKKPIFDLPVFPGDTIVCSEAPR